MLTRPKKAKPFHKMTNAELANRRVRLLCDKENLRGEKFYRGEIFEIFHKHNGLWITDRATRRSIRGISFADVDLVPEEATGQEPPC